MVSLGNCVNEIPPWPEQARYSLVWSSKHQSSVLKNAWSQVVLTSDIGWYLHVYPLVLNIYTKSYFTMARFTQILKIYEGRCKDPRLIPTLLHGSDSINWFSRRFCIKSELTGRRCGGGGAQLSWSVGTLHSPEPIKHIFSIIKLRTTV